MEADPNAKLAVGLQQAELQISRNQFEQALATLNHLRELQPRHPYVLYLLSRLYRQLGDWQALKGLVDDLRRLRGVPREQLDSADAEATRHLLEAAGKAGDAEAVRRLWKSLPRALRRDPQLVVAHARALDACGLHEQAVDELLAAIDRQWDPALVEELGRLHPQDPMRVLGHAERWLKDHGNDAVLLRTLGRLALLAELWGKARRYLETALDLAPEPETCRLLGELLERLGEQDAALACYRRGLALAATEGPPKLPSGPREVSREEAISQSPTLTLLGQ
ncbi:MAG: heme biosynthesis protein HemY [Gammaproteobacteria bacterium]|nr:MAG: heme biosynthesis protein HemY [Gammaproteobacteria bacterium]